MTGEPPGGARALFEQARAHHRAGRLDAAAALCFRVMRLDPAFAPAPHMMGLIAHQKGGNEQAIRLIEHALALDVRVPEYHHDLAVVLAALGRSEESLAALRRLAAIAPAYAPGRYSLGTRLMEDERFPEAIAELKEAVRLKPDYAEAWSNLGKTLYQAGEEAEAFAAFRRAVEAVPGSAALQTNLGNLEHLTGANAAAIARHRHALALDPRCADAHFNLAHCLLLEGEFAEGWREYEWRFASTGFAEGPIKPFAHLATPAWEGRPMRAGRLLVHYEQGLGDTIHFARYLRPAKERLDAEGGTAELVFACPKGMGPLFRTLAGPDRLVEVPGEGRCEEAHDARIALVSLPHLFGTTLETVPAEVPYLSPDPERVRRWGERLGGIAGLKVGLSWQGNPRLLRDRYRSLDPALLAPLADLAGVTFVGLQKGAGVRLAEALARGGRVVDLGPGLDREGGAFLDTAAVMRHLDLVISVDTAIAHLAGALARPCWVLLARVPDWRWLAGREDSPWYPTLRLFRQARAGDWPGVIGRVGADLARLAGARGGGRA